MVLASRSASPTERGTHPHGVCDPVRRIDRAFRRLAERVAHGPQRQHPVSRREISMYWLLIILLAVVVLALLLGGFGYYRRGSQNTTIIDDRR